MYNPVDSRYKKAIEISGVKATINNIDTKILIKEANDSYGIDYKKIISSQDIKQGDYLIVNGVQYLICDIEEQMSQSVYHVGTFRKTMEIQLGTNLKKVQAIVDKFKGVYVDGQYLNETHDQYNFIFPSGGVSGSQIVYDGGLYEILSTDKTKDGIVVITGKFSTTYTPHTYTMSLNSTSQTLVETETYTIVASATDNGNVVSSPSLTFVSSNTTIANVDSNGVVRCIAAGSCNITVTYQNISAILALTVNAKPVTPVISYTENWSQPITGLKQYVTTVYSVTRSTNGVVENPYVDYVFDSAGQSLINTSKIIVTRKADNSFSIKNALINTTITCYVTITDHSSGHVIANQLLTFVKGI